MATQPLFVSSGNPVIDRRYHWALDYLMRGDAEAAFLLRPTRIEDVWAVAGRGEVMPQKSTFFYPKLTSGLLLFPLD